MCHGFLPHCSSGYHYMGMKEKQEAPCNVIKPSVLCFGPNRRENFSDNRVWHAYFTTVKYMLRDNISISLERLFIKHVKRSIARGQEIIYKNLAFNALLQKRLQETPPLAFYMNSRKVPLHEISITSSLFSSTLNNRL